jgi:ABC-type branched-subunit amino acid transport system ATPase component
MGGLMTDDLLRVENVDKSFGGHRVLESISWRLQGSAVALVGPNGAGKTTLLNIVAGHLRPDRGRVWFRGMDVTGGPPWRSVRSGLVKTFQQVRPFPNLTVEEHVRLFSRVRGPIDTDHVLQITGLEPFRDRQAAGLPFGILKRIELAKALAVRPTLLLLDEPIAGLSSEEARDLLTTLHSLKKGGTRMLIVEHRLLETLAFVDEVVALDAGHLIFHGPPDRFFEDPTVRDAYLGGVDARN